jgi:hypothetical protein
MFEARLAKFGTRIYHNTLKTNLYESFFQNVKDYKYGDVAKQCKVHHQEVVELRAEISTSICPTNSMEQSLS